MTDTNELRKLLAAATPLPWQEVVTRHEPQGKCIESASLDEVGCPTRVVDASCSGMEGGGFVRAEDLHLVVAAVNTLPALLDELDALRADLREAVALLQVFGFCIEPDKLEWVARQDALLAKHKETP